MPEQTPEQVQAEYQPRVQEAIKLVMRDVQAIGKNQRNREQGFNFRGVDDVVNAVGPALREHGVVVATVRCDVVSTERYKTAKGTEMQGVVVASRYRITGPLGDHLNASALGQSSDAGDKAIAKAQSVAYRVMLLQLLCIPTDEPDPDSEAHERATDTPRERAQAFQQQLVNPEVQQVNARITEWQQKLGWSIGEVLSHYAEWNNGANLNVATIDQREAFILQLTRVYTQREAQNERNARQRAETPPTSTPEPPPVDDSSNPPF